MRESRAGERSLDDADLALDRLGQAAAPAGPAAVPAVESANELMPGATKGRFPVLNSPERTLATPEIVPGQRPGVELVVEPGREDG